MHAPTSETYIRTVPLETRKRLGQYMTPATISTRAAETLKPLPAKAKILDPAAGTGELLLAIKNTYPNLNAELHGWDVDNNILTQAALHLPEAHLKQRSIFQPVTEDEAEQFDAIIANPPYFELKANHDGFRRDAWDVAEGRPNIYALFFEYALKLLKPEGRMVFIVPPSMNAGAYYTKLRNHLLQHTNILHLSLVRENSQFLEAVTSAQVITLQKTTTGTNLETNPHVINFTTLTGHGPTIFTDQKPTILNAWKNATSLWNAGYQVTTGSVLWNLHKDDYLEEDSHPEAHPLLYSKDITKTQTIQHHPALNSRRWLTLPENHLWRTRTVIVNRIVGSLTNPTIRAAIADGTVTPFYGENHLNIISPRPGVKQTRTLEDILSALTDTTTITPYLQALTGNTQLSARELEHLIPLPAR